MTSNMIQLDLVSVAESEKRIPPQIFRGSGLSFAQVDALWLSPASKKANSVCKVVGLKI